MYALSDTSGSRAQRYQSVVTTSMWRSKENEIGPKMYVIKCLHRLNFCDLRRLTDCRILQIDMCIDQRLTIKRLHQQKYILRQDAPYLLNENAAKAVTNEDQRSSSVL